MVGIAKQWHEQMLNLNCQLIIQPSWPICNLSRNSWCSWVSDMLIVTSTRGLKVLYFWGYMSNKEKKNKEAVMYDITEHIFKQIFDMHINIDPNRTQHTSLRKVKLHLQVKQQLCSRLWSTPIMTGSTEVRQKYDPYFAILSVSGNELTPDSVDLNPVLI